MSDPIRIEAITFDFFNTLVFHRGGRGRGSLLIEYLELHGFTPQPWKHSILYEAFEAHDSEYSPFAPQREKDEYYVRLAERAFGALGIPDPAAAARRHARPVWRILGPDRFGIFPDVQGVLGDLAGRGLPLAIVSNWQRGLSHFCHELGLSGWFSDILASAELGIEKPDVAIFEEACRRLGVPVERTLHVGDSLIDDYSGAAAAGMQVVLVSREGAAGAAGARVVGSLTELSDVLTYESQKGCVFLP